MEYTNLIAERYSCKRYADTPVDKDTLTRILEAGRLAPTAKNLQEVHVYVAESDEAKAKVDAVTPCRYGAPVVLVVAFDTANVFTYPGGRYQSGVEDTAIVATHLMLAAKNAGVDSCWVNNFDPDALATSLDLPEGEQIVLLLDLGYPAEGAGPLPNHGRRKPLEETVTFI